MTAGQAAGIVFTEVEKQLISGYFGKHPGEVGDEVDEQGNGHGKSKSLPPGLAKREHLPPGLEKHLEKNGTLPPGLAKRNLPPGLETELPPPHPGTVRVIVNDDVVLLQQATGVILDVLENVLGKK